MAEKIIIRPIVPKNPRYFESLYDVLVAELTSTMTGKVADILKSEEEKRIKNWDHKPEIRAIFTPQVTQLKLLVTPYGTNKRYWVFVSGGTPGKTYHPKKADYMTVRTGYQPKTRPGNRYGGSGQYTGEVYRTKTVHWPGIKAREFEKEIVSRQKSSIEKLMHAAVQRAVRSHG